MELSALRIAAPDCEAVDCWRPYSGSVQLSLRYAKQSWPVGTCLEVRSGLRRLRGFGNRGEFDWEAWNRRRGIWATAYAWNDRELRSLGPCAGVVSRLRRRLRDAALRAGGPQGGVVAALVTGLRDAVPPDAARVIREAGTAHALAISGLHLGLVTSAVFLAAYRVLLLHPSWSLTHDIRRPAVLVAALALLAYACLAGATPSVLRAGIMAAAALACLWWGRGSLVWPSFALAALVTTLWSPAVLADSGFRLSYAATAALVLWARRDPRSPGSVPFAGSAAPREAAQASAPSLLSQGLGWLVAAFKVSLLCQLVTLPIVAQDFHQIPLYSAFVNLLAAPLVTGATLSALLASALELLGGGWGDPLFALAGRCAGAWVALAGAVVALPGAVLAVPAPGVALVVSSQAALFAWLWGLGSRSGAQRQASRLLALGCLAASLALAVAAIGDRFRSDLLRVDVLSVGQGDATVLRLPGGAVVVVDAGLPGRGRLAVAPFLRRAGVGTIDILVATHADADHAGGLVTLVESFAVGELWLPTLDCAKPEIAAAVQAVLAAGGRVRERSQLPATLSFANGLARLTVMFAGLPAEGCANNDSLVLRASFGGRAVLLPGDIEREGEQALLAQSSALSAAVLKLPHHGSDTSSSAAFLEAVNPSLALVSAGWQNRFGFPAPAVLERLALRDTRVLRTDLSGSVSLRIDKEGRITELLGRRSFLQWLRALLFQGRERRE